MMNNCFQPRHGVAENKPDKFGIKFWLAADVKSTCLLNGVSVVG